MPLVRAIGKWGLTWLVVNAIVGSAVFALPAEYVARLGRASVLAVVLGGISTVIIMACTAEVASKFPEPGGSYIYARIVFGRFAGIQVGWFSFVVRLTSTAAAASLFVTYLGGLFPSVENGVPRAGVLTVLLGGLTVGNYIGVRSGANISSVFAVLKLSLLIALGLFGLVHAGRGGLSVSMSQISAPGLTNWFEAFLLLSFMYGGFETALLPLGEVENPRRVVPVALGVGLALCIAIYSLIQIAVLNTPQAHSSARPLSMVASALFGPSGEMFANLGTMVCIYGYLSASVLGAPRIAYALADKGDFPPFLAGLHARFKTPHRSIALFGLCSWAIAVTGSFRAALALSIGARLVMYGTTCAALIPLGRHHPDRRGLTTPFGPVLSVLGVAMTLVLVTRIHQREAVALAVTGIVATLNWWWISQRATFPGR